MWSVRLRLRDPALHRRRARQGPQGCPLIAARPRTRPLLFEALPDLAARTPWLPLAHVPTPVEPCAAIGDWLGRSDGVFMKRDDLVSPLYGGNKVRRFEFLLADARQKQKRRLVTVGGLASTQAMATAIFGRELGFEVRIVLFDQPVTRFARAGIVALSSSGAEIVYGGGYATTALRACIAFCRGRRENYVILPGAAGPLANLGYVDAMFELAAQVERGEAPRPDVIVLPTGSSGTLAALALGAAHLGWDTEIVGVRITSAFATNRLTIGAILWRTDRALGCDPRWRPMHHRARYRLYGGAVGPGYGHPTPDAIAGAALVPKLIGSEGEVTYSGKALVGLRELLADPRYRGKTVLLWNTLSAARPALPPDAEARVPPSLAWMFEVPPVA